MLRQALLEEALWQINALVNGKICCNWDLSCAICEKSIPNTTCPPEVLIKMVFNELDRENCTEQEDGIHCFFVSESGKKIGYFQKYHFTPLW